MFLPGVNISTLVVVVPSKESRFKKDWMPLVKTSPSASTADKNIVLNGAVASAVASPNTKSLAKAKDVIPTDITRDLKIATIGLTPVISMSPCLFGLYFKINFIFPSSS